MLAGRGRRLLGSFERICIIEGVILLGTNGYSSTIRLGRTAWSCLLGTVCFKFTVSERAKVKLDCYM